MRAIFYSPLFLAMACLTASGADETLVYSLKWPTGITMGSAKLITTQGSTRSEFTLDASLPGIPVTGIFTSQRDAAGCTSEFAKKYELGFRRSSERTTVSESKARRETDKGGKSTMDVGECARDGLAFLQMLRAELAAGHKPASQKILFGAQYTVTMEYPKPADAQTDTVKFSVKGPASQNTFEIDFLRDATRTPSRVRVPMAMGKFVLELVR